MLNFRRGDVILVDLNGGRGVDKIKVRPCVVVQNDRGNAKGPFTIVVPVTDHSGYRGYREQVEIPAEELGPGGKRSVAGCGEIRQIDRGRIDAARGVIASLPDARMKLIDEALDRTPALTSRGGCSSSGDRGAVTHLLPTSGGGLDPVRRQLHGVR